MHEHKDCEHQLKHCSKCDVVYCEKCNKEWKKESVSFYSGSTTTTWPPNGIYCGGTTLNNCCH